LQDGVTPFESGHVPFNPRSATAVVSFREKSEFEPVPPFLRTVPEVFSLPACFKHPPLVIAFRVIPRGCDQVERRRNNESGLGNVGD
jgi:hypothetical protein